MAKEVQIKISAQDNASPTFRKISGEAQTMGNQVTQSNERSGQSFQNFNTKAAALGAAIGTATGLLADWSRAAADDQAEQARLQQAIDNTGKSYDQYSKAVDQAILSGQKKAFTDTQVRDALVALTAVTNDAGASLNQLGLVEDFARAKGIDLSTSAGIIAKVMGGNLGILSRYGIQLDKNATSEQALAKIQQISAGQADVYGKSTKGWLEEQRIRVDELTEAWGYQLGSMQKILALMPGMSAGYSAIAGALSGIGGFGGLAKAAALGTQIAGIGALGTIAYGYAKNDEGATFANQLANKIFIVMSELINAAVPGANPLDTQKYIDQMSKNDTISTINALFGSLAGAGSALGIHGTYVDTSTVVTGNSTTGMPIPQDPNNPSVSSGYYANPTSDQVYAAIVNAAAAGHMTVAEYLATPAVRTAGIMASVSTLPDNSALANGRGMVTNPMSAYAAWLDINGPHFNTPQGGGNFLSRALFGGNMPVYRSGGSGAIANDVSAMGDSNVHYDKETRALIKENAAIGAREAAMAATTSAMDAIAKYAPGLGLALPTAGPDGATHAAGVAARATDANNGLASGFQVAVGNTNAIAAQAKAVNDWATELINVRGTYGEVDRLLSKGIITIDEYNRAQSAETSILHSNYDIQNDMLKIQTDQSPVMAQLLNEQQKYTDHIANDLTPAQQMLALAYMDTGEQAKANTALTLAAAAANGELGASGEKAATAMITGAAEADPYLKEILKDMGVISETDGVITVNYDDVKNGTDATTLLTDAINNLADLIAEAFGIKVDHGEVSSAADETYRLTSNLDELNNKHVSFTVQGSYITDYITNTINGTSGGDPSVGGSGGSGNIGGGQNGGGGFTDPFGDPTGAGMNGLTAYANGGTAYDPLLPRFKHGGSMYALVGEVGPEIVKLSRGDQVTPTGASRSQMSRMTKGGGGNTNFYGPVTLVPAGQDAHRAISQAALGEARY